MCCNVIDQLNSFAAARIHIQDDESFQNSEESEGIWRDGPVITVNVLCNICESRNEIEYNTRAKYSE